MNRHAEDLTPHECDVVLALLSGSSNREVAEQLFISVKTVETHLTRIYRKLGYRSRGQVIAAYYTGGLASVGAVDTGRATTVGPLAGSLRSTSQGYP